MAITLSRGRSFAVALALLATGGLAQAADSVRVGSKIDTEGSLLGNLIVQVLEANGIKTTNKLQLGTTRCCAAPLRPAGSTSIRNTPATARFSFR